MGQIAWQPCLAVADDPAGDRETVAARRPLPDERTSLFGYELPRGGIEDLVQAIQQHQRTTFRQRVLEKRREAGQTVPLVVVDRQEISQRTVFLRAAEKVIIRSQGDKDRQGCTRGAAVSSRPRCTERLIV